MLKTKVFGRISFELPCEAKHAEIKLPCGTVENMHVFDRQKVSYTYDHHGYETVSKHGDVFKEARFTARNVGIHEMTSYDTDGKVLTTASFEAENHQLPGYVMVSEDDPRYFALSCGDSYVPIGLNLVEVDYDPQPAGMEHFEASKTTATIGLSQWRRWFKRLKDAGCNFARIRVSHDYTEGRTEIMGLHNLVSLERFDDVVELAREHGIRVKLCFEVWRTFQDVDREHVFYRRYVDPDTGKQLLSENTWFEDEKWNNLWMVDISPYFGRYHNDPVVFAWELWNEIDEGNACFDAVSGFTQRMLRHVKSMSPQNLATNSLGSFDDECKQIRYDTFRDMPEMDFQQVHRYLDQGAPMEICHTDLIAFSKEAIERSRHEKKPCILAETGAVDDRHVQEFRYYVNDHLGHIFHDVTYPAFFAGSAGSGHAWHWNLYVEAKNLFRFYTPLAKLLEGVVVHKENFKPSVIEHNDAYILLLEGNSKTLIYVRSKADRWDYVLRDGLIPAPVTNLTVQVKCKKADAFWIMDEAPGEVTVSEKGITLPTFVHGCVIRAEK